MAGQHPFAVLAMPGWVSCLKQCPQCHEHEQNLWTSCDYTKTITKHKLDAAI